MTKSPLLSFLTPLNFFKPKVSSLGSICSFQWISLSFINLPTFFAAISVHTNPKFLSSLYKLYKISSVTSSLFTITLSVTSTNIVVSSIVTSCLNNGFIIYGLLGNSLVFLDEPIFNTLSPKITTSE